MISLATMGCVCKVAQSRSVVYGKLCAMLLRPDLTERSQSYQRLKYDHESRETRNQESLFWRGPAVSQSVSQSVLHRLFNLFFLSEKNKRSLRVHLALCVPPNFVAILPYHLAVCVSPLIVSFSMRPVLYQRKVSN
jgi:hypothetical protein